MKTEMIAKTRTGMKGVVFLFLTGKVSAAAQNSILIGMVESLCETPQNKLGTKGC